MIIAVLFAGCQIKEKGNSGFYISGYIKGLDAGSAVIKRRVQGEWISVDSTSIDSGKFFLKGKLITPEMCYIFVADSLPPIRLFTENTDITVKTKSDSIPYADIKGSTCQDQLDNYNDQMRVYNNQLNTIYYEYQQAIHNGNKEKQDILDKKFDEVSEQQKEAAIRYVKENSQSFIVPYLAWGTLLYDLNLNEMEDLLNSFDPSLSESIYVKQLNNYIDIKKKVSVGQPMTDITLPDTTGADFTVSSLTGNVILINFWASWCEPCRMENPDMVSIYNDFKGQGFEIVGISLDEDPEEWEKVIVEDRIFWYHISDLQGWKNTGATQYGVRSLPHNVLIDREGTIAAKNLRGNELREKIKELIHE